MNIYMSLPAYWDDNVSIVKLMERRQVAKTTKTSVKPTKATFKKRSSPPPADGRTTFVFYSKSADAKPGKGAHEYMNPSDASQFEALSKVKDWRKVLSNFDECPFQCEGKTYNTIEHVFQSKKIAIADPIQAERFTVESGDPIGQGDGKMAQSKRKLVKLTPEQMNRWDHMKRDVMKEAARQKFAQCPQAMEILALTKGAKLLHLVTARGQKSTLDHFEHLERIRDEI